jgi:hypothetical protein
MARGGGRRVWWSMMERPRRGCEGREKSTDTVISAGVTLPSWRALGDALLPYPCAYRGNPRTILGSSGVVDASILEGADWYAGLQSARSVVGILRWVQRLRDIPVLVDPTLSALVSLFSLLYFFWACLWCLPQLRILCCIGVCYINIEGRGFEEKLM